MGGLGKGGGGVVQGNRRQQKIVQRGKANKIPLKLICQTNPVHADGRTENYLFAMT